MNGSLPSNVLERITPRDIHRYLTRHGWQEQRVQREVVLQFLSPDADDRFPILVPNRRDLTDYVSMVSRVLEIIASYERRPAIDLLEQMAIVCDVFKSMIASDSGTTSVLTSNALGLIEGSQDLFVYAASSELRRDVFFARRLKGAVELAERSRFGQTQIGSFVTTFYFPLPPRMQNAMFLDPAVNDDPIPLERRATTRLMTGLLDAAAASEEGDYRILLDRVGVGLNANMCEALLDVIEVSRAEGRVGFSMDMDSEWSRPDLPRTVTLSRGAVPVVTRAVLELRGEPKTRHVNVVGWVYQLHHEGRQREAGQYHIRVLWDSPEGLTYKVLVSVTPDDYATALEAHKSERLVSMVGDLQKIGRYWHLLGPRDLQVR